MSNSFRLYPPTRFPCNWWSENDYGAVLSVMKRLQPQKVVEFGPGASTHALIEGGAASVDCLEDNADWLATYQGRIVDHFPTEEHPTVVRMHAYTWADPLKIPALSTRRWDLALIDGPHGTTQRPPVIEWCLARCKAVLIPTEDHHCQGTLRPVIDRLGRELGRHVEYLETGPLSGGFALVTR